MTLRLVPPPPRGADPEWSRIARYDHDGMRVEVWQYVRGGHRIVLSELRPVGLRPGRFMHRETRSEEHGADEREVLLRASELLRRATARCASCAHHAHSNTICTARSGGTAYACGCTRGDAR